MLLKAQVCCLGCLYKKNRMKYSLLYCLLVLSILVTSSCIDDGKKEKMLELVPQTIKIGEEYYGDLKKENLEICSDMFSYKLYSDYSKEDVKGFLLEMNSKNGKLQRFDFNGTDLQYSKTNGVVRYLIINSYMVYYSSGYISEEQLIFEVDPEKKRIEKIDAFKFEKHELFNN